MASVDWRQLLDDARASSPDVVTARTFVKKWTTSSVPVLLRCDDDEDYVVKGVQAGRVVMNDQVVARLGRLAGAPVGNPMLVDVPQALIDAEAEMAHMTAGVGHGTTFLVGCSEQQSYEDAPEAANRPRFAALSLLFGWTQASDAQFIYENAAPHLVHSVDHGHFFPNGPQWTVGSLAGAPPPTPDPAIIAGAGLSTDDIDEARDAFYPPTDEEIAAAVGVVPGTWGLAQDEEIELAQFLAGRRDVLFP